MLQSFSPRRIRSILTLILFSPRKFHFSTDASIQIPNKPYSDLPDIAKSVISKRSATKGETFTICSLKDYIWKLSNISPEIVRRFWRVSVLKPEDVLEILLGFESKRGNCEFEVTKVESLYGIFKWASGQTRDFHHLPQSCKITASMLVRLGDFREVEYLLSRRESLGILLDCTEIFSHLIEGHLGAFELDRAVLVYERMRRVGLVPSISSYVALLKYLFEIEETRMMYRVYMDVIEMGMVRSIEEKCIHDKVIRLLCVDGKVQEGRDLVKRVVSFGIRPSNLVVNVIICGYCHKKDYDDILSFFNEVRIIPDGILGNKILFSLCRDFGVEQASMFLQKLEGLGFSPDEVAFGILIGFSCREGKLKNAFFHISDILSKGLKPHVYSYNALLSGMFKDGMWMHTRDVFLEMIDNGVTPNMSTFKILLAGFCKARQFDEVKAIVCEMADHNIVKHLSLQDPLTEGFLLLGLSPSSVKIRRDNDKGFSKTEFFDKLGNGLYLDTDLDEYEKALTQILDDSMMPDFNSYVIEKLCSRDIKETLVMVDEMTRWGQEMYLPTLSSLLSRLCRSPFAAKTINHYLGVMTRSTYQLDPKTLNTLVQTYSKKGFMFKARILLDGMVQRGYTINDGTFSALLWNTCKKSDLRSFHYYSGLARSSNWSSEAKDSRALLGYLCKNKWFNEAFELFETILFVGSDDTMDAFHLLIEELCCQGFTDAARVFLDEFSNQARILDHKSYSSLVSGFCREKSFTEAFEIFETMNRVHLSPPIEVSIQLISRLCRTNYDKAVLVKDICLRDQPSAQLPIHCAYINGLCKSGRFEEAISNLFKEVLLKGLVPDADVFNALIEGYCGRNNLKKVGELVGVMIRKNLCITISSYSKIVRLTCTEDKFSLALSLKELMLQVTDIPELLLYNFLLFHVSSMGNSFLLEAVTDALQKKGLQFDDVTYNFVIRGFLLCKDVSHSLDYLTTMMRQDLKPSNRSLRGVVSCLCRDGDLGKALNLSREMELKGWVHGSVIQNYIVRALITDGKLDEAVEFLDRMALKDLIPDNVKYEYLIKQFCQHGRLDKAVDLLNIMLRKGSLPESTSYDYIIQGFCDGRRLDMALDFHTEMLYKDLKPKITTWDTLIYSITEYRSVEEAENLLKSMIELGETPSRGAFECVINKYQWEKNVSKTSELLKVMQQKGYVPDFDTHWSLISNLSNSSKNKKNGEGSFLSTLLSGSGFAAKNNNSKTT